jgi:putative membrane protein
VLGSIATYYGFSMYRTGNGILVKRGLLTRHEIHVEKSRIQSIALRQDWLDYLLGRRNVLLEPIAHGSVNNDNPAAAAILSKRILVPSVRLHETAIVTDEVLRVRPEALQYTPAGKRLFYRYAVLFSVVYAAYLLPLVVTGAWWLVAAVVLLWFFHMSLLRMSWKRKGIAIDGDIVVVRSGVIGVNYAIFSTLKLQRITHWQSWLMRRRQMSTLVFSTASTTARMPYVDTRLASSVIDYCLYAVESAPLRNSPSLST